MKISQVVMSLVLAVASAASGGPVEEVQESGKQRAQAYEANNLDGYMASWADNAVFTASTRAYRFEGKEAIRALYAGIFQNYPTRKLYPHHTSYRAFGDNLVIANGYQDIVWVDRAGGVTSFSIRTSAVWVRIGGKWLTVDAHFSKGP